MTRAPSQGARIHAPAIRSPDRHDGRGRAAGGSALRAQVEAVRVHEDYRGDGLTASREGMKLILGEG